VNYLQELSLTEAGSMDEPEFLFKFTDLHTGTEGKPAPAVSPHEQRLAELREKREDLEWKLAMEREMAKKLANDAIKLSMEPLPDPDERQFLMNKMDEVKKEGDELVEEINRIDAEIANEEQQLTREQTSTAETPASAPSTAPSVELPLTTPNDRRTLALPEQPSGGSDILRTPPFALVGTVMNTTNPNRTITSRARMDFGQDGTCSLTISPPLIGSGACRIAQYDQKSRHIEITSTGNPNIS